jgi:helix-turn-helix protein
VARSECSHFAVKGWLDLTGASAYTSLSVRTLRRYLSDPIHPLPANQVGQKGKWLIRPEDLDRWIQGFEKGPAGVEHLVDNVLRDMHIGQRPIWKRAPDAVPKVSS